MEQVSVESSKPQKTHRLPSMTPRTIYRVKKLVKVLRENPGITNQELTKIFRAGLSSVSRLKTLAVEYGYAPRHEVMGKRFDKKSEVSLEELTPRGTIEVSSPFFVEPPPTTALPLIAPPARSLSTPNLVYSDVFKKLATLLETTSTDEAYNIWRDIEASARFMSRYYQS